MKIFIKFISIVLLAIASFSFNANATLIFELDTFYSNSNEPNGNAPWLRATFEQKDSYTVTLTLDNLLQSSDEFVSNWYFNFDPLANAANLIFNPVGTTDSGNDDFTGVGGSGRYDIEFSFDTSNSPSSNRFTTGKQFVYDITLSNGDASLLSLDEEDFNYLSTGGGNGTYYSSAHIQGIGEDAELSTFIASECLDENECGGGDDGGGGGGQEIPEPGTLLLFAIALLAVRYCNKSTFK